MTLKQYNWKNGPDLIQQHSVAKHRILQAYLAAYFRTLVSSPNQEVMRLTLVDGFAGGRLFLFRQRANLFEQRGEPSVRAENVDARMLKGSQIRRGAEI